MNQPRQPTHPPADGKPSDTDPTGESPNGIPDGMDEHEPKGQPSSDRHKTETGPG